MSASQKLDDEFLARRIKARIEVNKLDADRVHDEPERTAFFNTVYDRADGDAAMVPWADMRAKQKLSDWLQQNQGNGKSAIDVACGLGDNAEALAACGYKTTAFDLSNDAIKWAQQRFANSAVSYQSADLLNLPPQWQSGFDLVHECYTLQALPPQMIAPVTNAIASLVRPGGTLLVYTRMTTQNAHVSGPPWPLTGKQVMAFEQLGFELVRDQRFTIERPDKTIPHSFAQWKLPA